MTTADANKEGPGWSQDEVQVGVMNPEYQPVPRETSGHINELQSEASESTKQPEYDVVRSIAPPPLPQPRQNRSNPFYEPSGDRLRHPNTLSHKQEPITANVIEPEADYSSIIPRKCSVLLMLSVLVAVGLMIALIATLCAILMMFGIIPLGACPETSSVTNCSCPDDPQILMERLMSQARVLSQKIDQLNSSYSAAVKLSTSEFNSLNSRAGQLAMSVNSTNSSCHATLDSLQTNVILKNTTFKADMTDVDMFSECQSEYLSNCTIGLNDTACQTEAHPVTYPGYYNVDLSCHTIHSDGTRNYDTVNNIVLHSNQMSCTCLAIEILDSESTRNTVFTCLLFRLRCPINHVFKVPIMSTN